MRLFDTDVQELKYKVLKEVVRQKQAGRLDTGYYDIPRTIIPGPKATMRCCIYRERAIVEERVHAAMGGDADAKGVVTVINSACDECPVQRFSVTDACRGCIAHKCRAACPFGAIRYEKHKAVIDPEKCKECGRCMRACPYNAIIEHQRPCVAGCTAKAISIDEQKKAAIDYDRCISCGNCVYQCPFGAMVDRSFVVQVLDLLKEAQNGGPHVWAVLAPSIASQFSYVRIGQVVTGIRRLGFHDTVEAALGADIVARKEAHELAEKGFLTSSCCPSFVRYVEVNHPKLAPNISHNVSPMVEAARLVKQQDPGAKTVFIGPCIAKKMEMTLPKTGGAIDSVLTFEELQALFDGMNIDLEHLPEAAVDDASAFGRGFAKSGGVSQAVARVAEEDGLALTLDAELCGGAESYKTALLKAEYGRLGKNFIEGMSCPDGCVGGAACLTHGPKSLSSIDLYAKDAARKQVGESVDEAAQTVAAKVSSDR